jgi:signal peptidase II
MSDAGTAPEAAKRDRPVRMPPPLPVAASGWRWLPLAVAVVLVDQLVKSWIVHHFEPLERVHVLRVLDIILTYNTGAAFSFLAGASGWQRWVFVFLALTVSVVLIGWMRRLNARVHSLLACGLALIVGGAVGNLVDRLIAGRVVDFIHVHWGRAYFPAFNVADSAITVGAVVLLIDAFLETRAARPVRG